MDYRKYENRIKLICKLGKHLSENFTKYPLAVSDYHKTGSCFKLLPESSTPFKPKHQECVPIIPLNKTFLGQRQSAIKIT